MNNKLRVGRIEITGDPVKEYKVPIDAEFTKSVFEKTGYRETKHFLEYTYSKNRLVTMLLGITYNKMKTPYKFLMSSENALGDKINFYRYYPNL